jgi:hypothetical protein
MGRRGGERSLNIVQYLVAASREAGDVGGEDEGENSPLILCNTLYLPLEKQEMFDGKTRGEHSLNTVQYIVAVSREAGVV